MKEERRKLILEAASRLFAERGAAKTRVADVAREARIAVGSVYLEFPSKDALLGAIASSAHSHVLGAMRAALEGTGGPAARLRAALDARFETFARLVRHGHFGYAVFDSRCCRSIAKEQSKHRERERRLLGEFISANEDHFVKVDVAALLDAYAVFAPPLLLGEREALSEAQARLPHVHAIVFDGIVR